ncbi:hypothetical protein WOLCODRAFT_76293 [Wolfiporia cocos MD-104 SS10]|uniref:mRNA decay factor PAT1 domain-containing protein n=1 Tax=Wolfiporia cocos (strain MD-104) TaxID=742152 RepID=A0A2H3K6Y0_WOLCO|nr:hypothetical protein WOLCODRAFT_76293 [Wolfiporia cocos MD-104 SS10]
MSFFGFEQTLDLEAEKRKILQGGFGEEDVPVYNWGEESYDGLGDQLQEGGDELNDETFGGAGAVGKDFDFSNTGLPSDGRPAPSEPPPPRATTQPKLQQPEPQNASSQSRPALSFETAWNDKSPFSVLQGMSGAGRPSDHTRASTQNTKFSPFGADAHATGAISIGGESQKGLHTLEEVEAQMRLRAAQQQQQQQPSIPQSHLANQVRETQLREEAHLREVQLRENQLLRDAQLRGQIPRQGTPQHAATPPPRMHPHSQSPRFHQQQQQHQINMIQQQQHQQRQLLELQELRERQQQRQLLQLQEQLRLEELERQRQLRLQQAQTTGQLHTPKLQQRHASGRLSPSLSDRHQLGRSSPAVPLEMPFQQSLPFLTQDIQQQQRMLAQMAQEEFLNSMQGRPPIEDPLRDERDLQIAVDLEMQRKIREQELADEKRRIKQEKIAYMSRYNDLMTQSDKDFITRIQVSQLVTPDPFSDDYYAQVFTSNMLFRMNVQSQDERVLKFGSIGGVGLGVLHRGAGRRPNAMQRMEAQVERIVNNARTREKEKMSLNHLQGALGKTSGRSYKAAPRQLLQVDAGSVSPSPSHPALPSHAHISKADATKHEDKDKAEGTKEETKNGVEAPASVASSDSFERQKPMTQRETLMAIEYLYDIVLETDQLVRDEPQDEEVHEEWSFIDHIDQMWKGLRVDSPLEISIPHPFISLMGPLKGKRLLPRVARYLDTQQMLTVLTLIVACFNQLDVVAKAHLLDTLDNSDERTELENQTYEFVACVVGSVLPVATKASWEIVCGLLRILDDRNDIVVVAQTRPGIALLTAFFARLETIQQNAAAGDISEMPTSEEQMKWQILFDRLLHKLAPTLQFIFPSVRISVAHGIHRLSVPNADERDKKVWQVLATMALLASGEQHSLLVASLRDVVLETINSVREGALTAEEKRARLINTDLFLNAMGLSSSQILSAPQM